MAEQKQRNVAQVTKA